MTPRELKNSILQLAIQGKLVAPNIKDFSVDLSVINQKKTDDYEFELPDNWKLAHLESVTKNVPSKQYQILESQVLADGRFPVISQSKAYSIGFSNEADKVYHHDKPVIIFGDHTTEVKFVEFDFVVGADGVKIFEPIDDIIADKFLFYIFEFYSRDLSKIGGYSRHYKYIKNKPIPIPPLAEQKRIVSKIEELLPYIDRYEQAWSKLEQFNSRFPEDMKKSLLQYAIQGKLVEQRPEEGTAEELFAQIQSEKQRLIAEKKIKKVKPLPEITEEEKPFDIPESWKWVRLLSVIDIATNLVQPSEYAEYMHIAPDNIEKGTGRLLECRTVKEDKVASVNHLFKKGQIIYSKIRPLLRKAVIAPFDGLCSADMYPLNTTLNKKYVLYYLLSDGYNVQIANAMSSRVKMPKINQNELTKVLLPLPPLAEQKRIVEKLEQLLPLCERLK